MIRAYCVDTITIRRITRGAWSEPSASSIAVKGYVDWKTKLVRNIKGEQVVAMATVYLIYDGLLTHEDRLVIDGIDHGIINIVVGKDFSKNHYEAYIQ